MTAAKLADVSSKALGHRVESVLARFVGPNNDAWAALRELVKRAEKDDRG